MPPKIPEISNNWLFVCSSDNNQWGQWYFLRRLPVRDSAGEQSFQIPCRMKEFRYNRFQSLHRYRYPIRNYGLILKYYFESNALRWNVRLQSPDAGYPVDSNSVLPLQGLWWHGRLWSWQMNQPVIWIVIPGKRSCSCFMNYMHRAIRLYWSHMMRQLRIRHNERSGSGMERYRRCETCYYNQSKWR